MTRASCSGSAAAKAARNPRPTMAPVSAADRVGRRVDPQLAQNPPGVQLRPDGGLVGRDPETRGIGRQVPGSAA